MDVREATSTDRDGIRRVADASLAATYSDTLGEDIVAKAADEWYEDDRLADRLGDDEVLYLVVVDDGEVVAFSESEFDVREQAPPSAPVGGDENTVAAIQWLHVHPDYRGRGIGKRLLEHTETELLDRGANRVEGRVLAANEDGNAFYQSHGYARTGQRTLDLGGESYTEHLYVKLRDGEQAAELTEERDIEDGTVFVAYDERERGSLAPFYATYRGRDRTDRYGFYCGNCESVEASMDAMGRIECPNCGNKRKATRWDAAYL